MRALVVTLSLYGLFTLTSPAAAERSHDVAAAQALFERGRVAAQRGDWQMACDAFEESQRLDPGAGTLMNWAMCEARQNKLASAWHHFNEAAALLAPGDDRTGFVRAQLRQLAPRLPRLTLRLSPDMPAGARVLRDGAELAQAGIGLPMPVDPGRVELQVLCAGRTPRRSHVEVHEAEQLEVTLEPGAELEPNADVAARPGRHQPPSSSHLQRDLGLSLVVVGSLSAGLGLASGVVVAQRQRTAEARCPGHVCDASGFRAVESGERWLVVNTVAWSLGAAALVSGAVLLYVAPARERDASIQMLPGGGAFVYRERY
jgi:hypothetical protein